jgi:hypothetical protein
VLRLVGWLRLPLHTGSCCSRWLLFLLPQRGDGGQRTAVRGASPHIRSESWIPRAPACAAAARGYGVMLAHAPPRTATPADAAVARANHKRQSMHIRLFVSNEAGIETTPHREVQNETCCRSWLSTPLPRADIASDSRATGRRRRPAHATDAGAFRTRHRVFIRAAAHEPVLADGAFRSCRLRD